MEHILSKEEPKFDYNIILVDSDKKEECSSLFQDHEDIIIEIKEREMTKEQIEKELGYKIKIKE